MSRTYTGKISIGIRRIKRPNGNIYVYERHTAYDQSDRRVKTIKTVLKGKIPAGETEIVPARPKKKSVSNDTQQSEPIAKAGRNRVGVIDILNYIGKESGIDDDLYSSYSEGEAQKIISVARYMVATGGRALPRMEAWQANHPTVCQGAITEDVYSDLFRSLGLNEQGMQSYFALRTKKCGAHPLIAFDSTTISTYAENQPEARYGFNKDHDGLKTIKLLTLYSLKNREPLAFTKQQGNLPDVISLENAMSQLQCLGTERPTIITDNGYFSESNMALFCHKNLKFITLASKNIRWIKDIIDTKSDRLSDFNNICPFDRKISCLCVTTMHKFDITRKNDQRKV